jgi:chorismate mutase
MAWWALRFGLISSSRYRMVGNGLVRVAVAVVVSATLGLVACAPEQATGTRSLNGTLVVFVDLAAQRVQVADTVAASKWGTEVPITDRERERAVLASAATKSAQLGIDPAVSVQVFTDQIEASKAVQYALYSQWSAHPARAPSTRPDLAQVRPVLDRITDGLLAQLKATQELRADFSCAAQLASAQRHVEQMRTLDQLHGDALGRALASLCRGPEADGVDAGR